MSSLPGESTAPYVEFDRASWSRLAASTPLPLTSADVDILRGLGDPIDLDEVDTAYRPLSRLLNLYVTSSQKLRAATGTFLSEQTGPTPSATGVAGPVAVGRSPASRVLRGCRARGPEPPRL